MKKRMQDKVFLTVLVCVSITLAMVCLVLFVILTIYGIRYTQKLGKNATSLPIKMRWVFLCVPVSTCVMAWHAFVLMLESGQTMLLGGKEAKN